MPSIHRSPKKEWIQHKSTIRYDVCKNKPNEKKTEKAKNHLVYPPPPLFFFNISVATNVAKTFLTLIDKHFPKDKKISKIFNRNTLKVS